MLTADDIVEIVSPLDNRAKTEDGFTFTIKFREFNDGEGKLETEKFRRLSFEKAQAAIVEQYDILRDAMLTKHGWTARMFPEGVPSVPETTKET